MVVVEFDVEALRAENAALRGQIASLVEQVAKLNERVVELLAGPAQAAQTIHTRVVARALRALQMACSELVDE